MNRSHIELNIIYKLQILSMYVPTSTYNDVDIGNFYEDVEVAMKT